MAASAASMRVSRPLACFHRSAQNASYRARLVARSSSLFATGPPVTPLFQPLMRGKGSHFMRTQPLSTPCGPDSRAAPNRQHVLALLKGLLFGADGRALSPTHTRKGGRLYRYYVAQRVMKGDAGGDDSIVRRVSAAEIEGAVMSQVRLQRYRLIQGGRL